MTPAEFAGLSGSLDQAHQKIKEAILYMERFSEDYSGADPAVRRMQDKYAKKSGVDKINKT